MAAPSPDLSLSWPRPRKQNSIPLLYMRVSCMWLKMSGHVLPTSPHFLVQEIRRTSPNFVTASLISSHLRAHQPSEHHTQSATQRWKRFHSMALSIVLAPKQPPILLRLKNSLMRLWWAKGQRDSLHALMTLGLSRLNPRLSLMAQSLASLKSVMPMAHPSSEPFSLVFKKMMALGFRSLPRVTLVMQASKRICLLNSKQA